MPATFFYYKGTKPHRSRGILVYKPGADTSSGLTIFDSSDCCCSTSTSTSSTTSESSTSTSTSSADLPFTSAGNCCDTLPDELTATVKMRNESEGVCASQVITLTKDGGTGYWTGSVSGWCSDPADFDVEFDCETWRVRVDGGAWMAAADGSTCLDDPIDATFDGFTISDSSCCAITPGGVEITITE